MNGQESQGSNALDDLLNTLDLSEGATETPATDPAPAVETPAQPTTTETPATGAPDGTEQTPPADGTQTEQTLPADKTNQAFAQMRVQNKQLVDVMTGLLTRLNLDPNLAKNPQEVQQLLDSADVKDQAKEMNVPAELLQRLTQLERAKQEQEQGRLSDLAVTGFKTIKTKYSLTDADIATFATQLQAAGTNPFEKELDLDMAYRAHNLDKIVESEVQKAVQAALGKQKTAAAHSTVPTTSNGKPDSTSTGDAEINTMAQFDKLLRQIK